MQVGLFGGSFNPPHAGHALVAEIALRRLALDQLWWIVTPGNPLKNARELAPLAERIGLSEADRRRSAHQGDRLRGEPQSALHRRHAGPGQGAQSGRRFRLDHGRRQSARLPPLAALAADRADLSDRRHRPAGLDAFLPVVGGGQDLRLCAGRRGRCAAPGAHARAGLDLHPRPALVAVVDRDPGRGESATPADPARLFDRSSSASSGHVAFAASRRPARACSLAAHGRDDRQHANGEQAARARRRRCSRSPASSCRWRWWRSATG